MLSYGWLFRSFDFTPVVFVLYLSLLTGRVFRACDVYILLTIIIAHHSKSNRNIRKLCTSAFGEGFQFFQQIWLNDHFSSRSVQSCALSPKYHLWGNIGKTQCVCHALVCLCSSCWVWCCWCRFGLYFNSSLNSNFISVEMT